VVFMTFYGEFRGREVLHGHEPHESPKVMTIPLMLLAIGAVCTGWLGIPHVLGGENHFGHFMEPVLGHPHFHIPHAWEHNEAALEFLLMTVSTLMGVAGIALAYVVYIKKPELQRLLPEKVPCLYRYLYRKWYWDEIYHYTIILPVLFTARGIVQGVLDAVCIEGTVNGIPDLVRRGGEGIRRLQSGVVNTYALIMATGAAVVLLLIYLF